MIPLPITTGTGKLRDMYLAFSQMSVSDWSVLIGVITTAIVTIIAAIQNNSKMNVAQVERKEARLKAEKSEVKIDKTLSNTNGKVHKMIKEVADLKQEIVSLKGKNTTLEKEAIARKSPHRTRPKPKSK